MLWDTSIWERCRSLLRGSRSMRVAGARTVKYLMELFRPQESLLALPDGRGDGLAVAVWCTAENPRTRVPTAEESGDLLRRWGEALQRAAREGEMQLGRKRAQVVWLSPVKSSAECHGVLAMGGLAPGGFGSQEARVAQIITQDLAGHVALLKDLGSERNRDQESASLRNALEKERHRVKELERLLSEMTRSEAQRTRELENMTEQWLSMKTFNESVLQSMSSGLLSVDRRGRITYMNRGAEEILQYSAEEVIGKRLSAAMAAKDKRDLLAATQEEDKDSIGRQIQVMRKDGVEIPVGFTISPHRAVRGKEIGKIIHFRDLTRINEMQEELLRMDRLVSLGEISMGIAHEIRNPLAGIRITAQALGEEVSDNESLQEYIARILSEIDRLNELMKSFFSFAKPQKPQRAACNIPEMIQEVLFLVRKDLEKRNIRVLQRQAENLPSVYVDVSQIKQVLLNLLLNSIQAISRDGRIAVTTTVANRHDRGEIVIGVSDTGKGILPEHQAKIFDPFFTTKAKGLGLGLSITYRIVKRHGGYIRVHSEPGKGTTFRVHLPLEAQAAGSPES
jgi:PAS domain S-box-containing protein